MRIVFIRSNPVDPDSRVEKEVDSLVKGGYDVTILGWDRGSKYKIIKSKIEFSKGTANIYRFGIPAEFGAGIKNLKAFILFQIKLIYWLIKNRKNYEVIHACDFDTAFTSSICAKLLKKKMVFDIFDYLYSSHGQKISIFGRFIVYLQNQVINFADATIICTEQRKQQIKGTNPKKLVVIHNSPPKLKDGFGNLNLNREKIKIVYVGILQDNRFLHELANVIIKSNNLELHIGGFGKYEDYFDKLSKTYNNIKYYGKLPYYKTLELEHNCDIMTAIYDPKVGNHYYAAPNKFYEALMLGKPLIMVKNTGMSNVVAQNKIGELMEFNIDGLKGAIKKLIARKSEWIDISNKMKDLYDNNYSWDEMETRLLMLYEKL